MSVVKSGMFGESGDHLVQGVFDDAFGTKIFQFRNEVANNFFRRHNLNGYPPFVDEFRDGREPERR